MRNKVAFFDTFAAMGGADHMDGWVHAEPKVAYKDRVHFTDIGYQRWADALSGALLDQYDVASGRRTCRRAKPVAPPPLEADRRAASGSGGAVAMLFSTRTTRSS